MSLECCQGAHPSRKPTDLRQLPLAKPHPVSPAPHTQAGPALLSFLSTSRLDSCEPGLKALAAATHFSALSQGPTVGPAQVTTVFTRLL